MPPNMQSMIALEQTLGPRFEQLAHNERNTLLEVFGALGIDENIELTLLNVETRSKIYDDSSCQISFQAANGCTLEIIAWTSKHRPPGYLSNTGFLCHCVGNPLEIGQPVEVCFSSTIDQRSNTMDFSWGSLYFQLPEGYKRNVPQIYLNKDSFARQKRAIIESPGSIKPPMPEAFVSIEAGTISEAYFAITRSLLVQ